MHAGDPYDLKSVRFNPEVGGYERLDPASVVATGGGEG
jgi:hypothetical protein